MSLRTVARDDFRNARRSYVVLGVSGVLVGLITLIFVSEIDIYDDPFRTLFDVSAFVAFVVPLFLAPLAYLCIAGDRGDGAIKFVMGLPNTRLEYYAGKFLSRAGVAVVATAGATVVGFLVAAVAFGNAPDPARFAVFGGLSVLYVLAVVSVFVAISASTARRSRAMFGALAAYFLLVPFWFGLFPVINLETIVDAVASLLGTEVSDRTRRQIAAVSPTAAYFEATEAVYRGVLDQYAAFGQFGPDGESDRLVVQTWFNVVLLGVWTVVPLAVGYLRFRVAELG